LAAAAIFVSSDVTMTAATTPRKVPSEEAAPACEAALYAPVKHFLERQGYTVRGEVRGCDVVACRGDEPPVIVELKLRFNLSLLLQGIDRLTLSERIYLAVPRPSRHSRGVHPEAPEVRRLCRRLGLGLLVISRNGGMITVVEEPVPYRPRPSKRRTELLLGEFARRSADLNVGGSSRSPIVTGYREDSLRCARVLAGATTVTGAMRLAELRTSAGVPDAGRILQRNVYGWFARIERGTYGLSAAGHAALERFAEAVAALTTLMPQGSRG
jgi:hypothetical protein